jgi:hypothetical protein
MKITKPSGRGRARTAGALRRRLARSLVAGTIVAGAIVAWDGLHNHAALVAAAAAPEPKGEHLTVASILASGGIVMALAVTGIVFAVATLLARRRPRSITALYPQAASRRRSRASVRW